MPDWWEGFMVGQLVRDISSGPDGATGLIVRLTPENENPFPVPRPVIEIQWMKTGRVSIQFTDAVQRVDK